MEPAVNDKGPKSIKVAFLIKENSSNWVAVGLCHKNVVQANNYQFNYSTLGHGGYLISSNGGNWIFIQALGPRLIVPRIMLWHRSTLPKTTLWFSIIAPTKRRWCSPKKTPTKPILWTFKLNKTTNSTCAACSTTATTKLSI